MTEKSPGNWKTVQDADLAQWLSSDGNDVRELIVEACLPDRKVTLGRRADGHRVPAGVESSDPTERAAALTELYSLLTALLDVPPVLLKAADANGFCGHKRNPPIEEAIKKFWSQFG